MFTATFFILGLSGVLPSAVALIQTVGIGINDSFQDSQHSPFNSCSLAITPTRFSVNTYFGILTSVVIISAIGFLLLNVLPGVSRLKLPATEYGDRKGLLQEQSEQQSGHSPSVGTFWSWKLVVLLIVEMYVNCLANGVTPAVSSFAFTPYGKTAAVLIVNIGMLAGPLTALVGIKLAWSDSVGRRAFITIGFMVVVVTALSSYIIWVASPMCKGDRPLQGKQVGVIHMVTHTLHTLHHLLVWYVQNIFNSCFLFGRFS